MSPRTRLSGGNQQKLIVGREMSANPNDADRRPPDARASTSAHRPRSGISSGTARAAGLATLLISADLDELIGLSDTIVVMFRGRIVATLDPADRHAARPRLVHDRCRRAEAA